jgi:glycosyltransferase involved in cell wall biosynthesis
MNEERPLVSIGLPVYNGEKFVAEAIQCVLDQSYSNWELIISDNCSTDSTMDICRRFAQQDSRIHVYQNARNMGVSYNYNEAFRRSRGPYFKWMAHDDLFAPEFIEKCVVELERDKSLVLVFSKMSYIDADRHFLRHQASSLSVLGETADARAKQLMVLARQGMDFIWLAYGVIRHEIIEQCGAMGLHAADDQVLLFKIALRGRMKQMENELFYRREHTGASTCKRGEATVRQRAKFAYADDNRRLVLPWCRLVKEHIISVFDMPLSFSGKLRCVTAVARRFLAAWRFFVEEAIHSPVDALRSH